MIDFKYEELSFGNGDLIPDGPDAEHAKKGPIKDLTLAKVIQIQAGIIEATPAERNFLDEHPEYVERAERIIRLSKQSRGKKQSPDEGRTP